jgi:hypothetical protein
MPSNNARLIEKDVLEDIVSTDAGSSQIVDLNGASKFSCQAVYDVISQSARIVPSSDITFGPDDSTFEFTAHGFVNGVKVQLTTDDTLPAPLAVLTDYFVIVLDANTFQLAETLSDAEAGIFIELDDSGVGNQTVTPVALAGASVTFQKSNDRTNWVNIQSATAITVDGSVIITQPDVSYRYFKAVKALTAGVVDLKAIVLVIGDAV